MIVIPPHNHQYRWAGTVQFAALLLLLAMTGCAQVNKLKSRVGGQTIRSPAHTDRASAVRTPAGSNPTLAAIVNDQLQHGDYVGGENALRRYLAQHPGDRSAQAMLHQLTADPEQALGQASQPHVVQPGDSYSTLAARYLGDASQFLILARYNDSNDPSLLRVGDTVRVPSAGADAQRDAATGDAPSLSGVTISPTVAEDAASTDVSAQAKASRLQREGVALFARGHREQALARLDEALVADPQLRPDGSAAVALRKELVTSLHQRAIVLYRDQRLDPAIRLWDRALAIDPHYEPAMVYRTRALELKRRLKQF